MAATSSNQLRTYEVVAESFNVLGRELSARRAGWWLRSCRLASIRSGKEPVAGNPIIGAASHDWRPQMTTKWKKDSDSTDEQGGGLEEQDVASEAEVTTTWRRRRRYTGPLMRLPKTLDRRQGKPTPRVSRPSILLRTRWQNGPGSRFWQEWWLGASSGSSSVHGDSSSGSSLARIGLATAFARGRARTIRHGFF